ncbi:hypothetical protein FGO68_gene10044 [Halteria grandinella]|uniref:Uncharacterized protein n=1 Tax=Halteria grandinella TaxID=5974 RepID=A0A8J8T100_HALGN|nr:hypothetical protein FGO68_gene10044 [Halteria grandinella]
MTKQAVSSLTFLQLFMKKKTTHQQALIRKFWKRPLSYSPQCPFPFIMREVPDDDRKRRKDASPQHHLTLLAAFQKQQSVQAQRVKYSDGLQLVHDKIARIPSSRIETFSNKAYTTHDQMSVSILDEPLPRERINALKSKLKLPVLTVNPGIIKKLSYFISSETSKEKWLRYNVGDNLLLHLDDFWNDFEQFYRIQTQQEIVLADSDEEIRSIGKRVTRSSSGRISETGEGKGNRGTTKRVNRQ